VELRTYGFYYERFLSHKEAKDFCKISIRNINAKLDILKEKSYPAEELEFF
jgi:hypothetical protein